MVKITVQNTQINVFHREDQDYISLVFERLFYSGYVAMAKIRFTEFLPSTGCHHSVCPHYRHLARP